MQTVVLCGGKGTRMGEETRFRPKPLIEIGEEPIIFHIMAHYMDYGFKQFVLCLGYKGEMLRRYFLEWENNHRDITVAGGAVFRHSFNGLNKFDVYSDWIVDLVDTGRSVLTGTRLKRVENRIKGEDFMLTYGDGLSDVNIRELVDFHYSHGKIGTVTGVRAPIRFGELVVDGEKVVAFNEKPCRSDDYINAGFFVFKREFFDYLPSTGDYKLEEEPLRALAKDGQLMVYKYSGNWMCMDTMRDVEDLNDLWKSGNAFWRKSAHRGDKLES